MPEKNFSQLNNDNLTPPNSTPRSKVLVGILTVLAVLILFLGAWQIRSQVRRPFDAATGQAVATLSDSLVVLSNRDTDGDGLSDYDEIYIYKTSPYLEDTDSDGPSDREELDEETNPNCPIGQNCDTPLEIALPDNTAVVQSGIILSENSAAADTESDILLESLGAQIDADTLRQLLIANGARAEDLENISDEDLLDSYRNILASQEQD
jgi:hypothetical protein